MNFVVFIFGNFLLSMSVIKFVFLVEVFDLNIIFKFILIRIFFVIEDNNKLLVNFSFDNGFVNWIIVENIIVLNKVFNEFFVFIILKVSIINGIFIINMIVDIGSFVILFSINDRLLSFLGVIVCGFKNIFILIFIDI